MRRLALPAAGAFLGVITGVALMLTVQGVSTEWGASTSTSTAVTSPAITSPTATTTGGEPTISDRVVVVWTPGGLPAGLSEQISEIAGVNAVTAVRSDLANLTESRGPAGEVVDRPPSGMVIPLEVTAFDPRTYPAFLPAKDSVIFAQLAPGHALLGTTSARLRRLAPGSVIELESGVSLLVAGVVDDVLIGAAELGVLVADADAIGVEFERYLLVRYSGSRGELEAAVRSLLPEGMAVRIRAPGETPVLRHGDAVLPQVYIKEQFGEFAYRPGEGQRFEIDPAWVRSNIETWTLPLLGDVTCHRNLLLPLAGAMAEIEERGLGFMIDPAGYRGCYNPRYIANSKSISRHAWGAAVDLNMGSTAEARQWIQDPRLVAIMEVWGFTSGHHWLIPDPGHFEYVRSPSGA